MAHRIAVLAQRRRRRGVRDLMAAVTNLAVVNNGDGTYTATWTDVVGATSYEVYLDGVLQNTVSQGVGTFSGPFSGASGLLSLDSLALEIAIGPQLPVGSTGLADGATYDSVLFATAQADAQIVIDACTRVWQAASGTLDCTSGSSSVAGTAVADIENGGWVRITGAGGRFYAILEKTGANTGILHKIGDAWYGYSAGTQRTWDQATQSGLTVERESTVDTDVLDDAQNTNYYDRIASLYRFAYRQADSDPTAAATLMALCDDAMDRWWQLPQFREGQSPGNPNSTEGWPSAPRASGLEGLFIRAIRSGNASMKTFLQQWAHGHYTQWVYNIRNTATATNAINDGRDTGYALVHLAIAVGTMSAGADKTTYTQRLIDGLTFWQNALDANGRLHFPEIAANQTNSGYLSQPFTLVHSATGLILAWQLFATDPDLAAYTTAKAAIYDLILDAAGGLYLAYLGPQGTFTNDWAGTRYFDDDVSVLTGAFYNADGMAGVPVRNWNMDLHTGIASFEWSTSVAQSNAAHQVVRQVGAMMLAVYAFVYASTGDAGYQAATLHILNRAFTDTGRRALGLELARTLTGWQTGNQEKHINEIMRHTSQAFAYLAGHRSY